MSDYNAKTLPELKLLVKYPVVSYYTQEVYTIEKSNKQIRNNQLLLKNPKTGSFEIKIELKLLLVAIR